MRVVHCQQHSFTHYIGRPSPLCNHYSNLPSKYPDITYVGSRAEAIRLFEQEARSSLKLMSLISKLPESAVLGCWCKPQDCHGDVIVKIWEELHA